MSWVERVLEDWGAWRRAAGDAQGWGGAPEMDRLFQLCKTRDPGVHSDPVGAEFAATERGEEAGRRTVDRYIQLCGPILSLTARLRYAGTRHEFEECGVLRYKDVVWAPLAIAQLMEVKPETVLDRLRMVRGRVRLELLQDAKNRKKERAARCKAA